MDVKRIHLWTNRSASLISNDLLRVIIEDQGASVIELSSLNSLGGRINAHPLHYFRGHKELFEEENNQEFWQNRPLLYYLGGSFFCFPNFGPPHQVGNISHQEHGWSATSRWVCLKYRTDAELGANWLLYKLVNDEESYPFVAYQIVMMLPGHPVLYSSTTIKNLGSKDLVANGGWHNNLGCPFLETESVVDLSAKEFVVNPFDRQFDLIGRLEAGAEFDDLSKAPLKEGGTCDLRVIPGLIGATDFVSGKIASDAKLGWASVINPRLKMVYFSFFNGPDAASEDDIILNFNNLSMHYGGRPFTPWAMYDGGTDQALVLGLHNSTGFFNNGLAHSLKNPTILDAPTTFVVPVGQQRTLRYASAFANYENVKMGSGVNSVEQVVEGVVLKRGKAWTLIECDSTFHFLKEIEKKLLSD
jgi:hypothetical protein